MGLKRGGFGIRSARLVSKAPLKADPAKTRAWQQNSRTELPRSELPRSWLATGSGLKRSAPPADKPKTPQQQRRTEQLKSWAEVKQQAHERDGWRCVGCGTDRDLECQHRANKGMGSSKLLDTIANALTLCRSCHSWADQHKNTEGAARGWTVPAGTDPATWPIRAADGCLYLHGDDGTRRRVG